jgi:uncharacterized membrane protein YphA (DoxX/SURF4 family)
MTLLIRTGRCFYAIALIVYGIQQFYFGSFRNVLLPAWQSQLPWLPVWSYAFGAALITAGIAMITEKKAREVSLLTGIIFLGLFCFVHVPYELISEPNKTYHLGLWTDALKELAYAGGAFIIAGTFTADAKHQQRNSFFFQLEKFIPLGSIFFCTTMTIFGIMHFMYADHVATMVPGWIPDHLFWTWFTAVALIGAGVCIVLNVRRKLVALLLSLMIFCWFVFLHLPAGIMKPVIYRGNILASAFDALLFSGTALVIAFGLKRQTGDEI